MTYAATGRVARITLNRPHRGNGTTVDMPRELGIGRSNRAPSLVTHLPEETARP